jgi:hypothetical protein
MRVRSPLLLACMVFAAMSLRADCPFVLLPGLHFFAGNQLGSIVAGDFNRDGYADLAILDGPNKKIRIVLGGAGGSFPSGSEIATDRIDELLTVDMNNDGKLDLIGSEPWSQNAQGGTVFPHLQVFIGYGDGTFVAVPYTQPQFVDQNPLHMVLGDFNGDPFIDIATTKSKGMGGTAALSQLTPMRNFGGQYFQPSDERPLFGANTIAAGIAAGDFDGDGKLDLAVSEQSIASGTAPRKVSIYYGAGNGDFVLSANAIDVTYAASDPADLKAGDFNGDGMADLAIVIKDAGNIGHPPLKIALSNGAARTFATAVDYGQLMAGGQVLIRDIDGDGKLDVLVADVGGICIFRGNGDGTFAAQQTIGSMAQRMAIADFDRDGGPDIATTFVDGVYIYLNNCGRVTLNLTSSANPSPQGTPVTITGTVVSPPAAAATGTITLKRGTTLLNSGNLNAGNSIAATMDDLTPATYAFTAEYSGDSRFVATIQTLQQVVTLPPFGPPPGLNAISFGGPVQLAWYATANTDHYEIWRSDGTGYGLVGSSSNASFTDPSAPPAAAFLYRVRAISAGGTPSDWSNSDLALTYAFTDGSLQAGVTTIKRAHLLELRNAANAVRALAPSLGPVSWADDLPGIIRASHLVELRTAVAQARAALGLSTLAYSNPAPSAGSVIRAIHIEELRAAMR